ncbi:hypothetical protein A3B57_01875 [Microgenomates group bacterium RIFCSPLOWO2_01_FULL_47_10]|nr:MAG: hypothetical protein A3B57_01875 [Microgenomates group bacterium RIFCSPLOWO2_01_FULL_47_10]
MPSKNALKIYRDNTYYHLYNRGVDKQLIFDNDHAYKTFLYFLKKYLLPPDETFPSKATNNFFGSITLHAHCLMPNHYHLLISQKNSDDINFFMRSINSQYVRYYNSHHNRIGPLFQSRYKAVSVNSDEQLLYLTKYIHVNPTALFTSGTVPEVKLSREQLLQYPYSSLNNYLGNINQAWLNTKAILSYFSKTNPHQQYADFIFDDRFSESIKTLRIDE